MKIESISKYEFKVLVENESENAALAGTYKWEPKFSNWQLMQIGKFMGQLTKECSGLAQIIATASISFMNTKNPQEIQNLVKQVQNITNGDLAGGFIGGMGELVNFLACDDRLPKLGAILFLKVGERKVKSMEERIPLFEEMDASVLFGAVGDFFVKRLGSWQSMLSPSKTSEMPKSENSNPILDGSTTISTGSTDTSTRSSKAKRTPRHEVQP